MLLRFHLHVEDSFYQFGLKGGGDLTAESVEGLRLSGSAESQIGKVIYRNSDSTGGRRKIFHSTLENAYQFVAVAISRSLQRTQKAKLFKGSCACV